MPKLILFILPDLWRADGLIRGSDGKLAPEYAYIMALGAVIPRQKADEASRYMVFKAGRDLEDDPLQATVKILPRNEVEYHQSESLSVKTYRKLLAEYEVEVFAIGASNYEMLIKMLTMPEAVLRKPRSYYLTDRLYSKSDQLKNFLKFGTTVFSPIQDEVTSVQDFEGRNISCLGKKWIRLSFMPGLTPPRAGDKLPSGTLEWPEQTILSIVGLNPIHPSGGVAMTPAIAENLNVPLGFSLSALHLPESTAISAATAPAPAVSTVGPEESGARKRSKPGD